MFLRDYILHNWALVLILLAAAVSLKTMVFLEKADIRRYHVLIITVFLLSITVFEETCLDDYEGKHEVLTVLAGIRLSVIPFILALIVCTLSRKVTWWKVYIPAIFLAAMNLISVKTGIVYSMGPDNTLQYGLLGFLPFAIAFAYCAFLLWNLFKHSSRQTGDMMLMVYFIVALASSMIMPFVFGRPYLQIFPTTVAITLYVYQMFAVNQITKKDPLTGLFNRQAFYADTNQDPKRITSIISIDMNGLKTINDTEGHTAGDEALAALGRCFLDTLDFRYPAYRVGGDEFLVVCRDTSREETEQLVEDLRRNIGETGYSCAVGYSVLENGAGSVEDLLREADSMMYMKKREYYITSGHDRRRRTRQESNGRGA